MSYDGTKTIWTAEEMEALRAEVRQALETDQTTTKALADQIGVAYQTMNAWLNAKYTGDNHRVAGEVARGLTARDEQRKALAFLPDEPAYQPTPTAETIRTILQYAQIEPAIVAIVGASGVGKTTAIEAYRRATPNVWMLTAEPGTGPYGVKLGLFEAMALDARNPVAMTVGRVAARVKGARGLIVVDEAQYLDLPAMNWLRTAHDRGAVGLAFVGNEDLAGRMRGGRGSESAQLQSRIGQRLTKHQPTRRDIAMLVDAWNVTDSDERAYLQALALRPGGLRQINRTMRRAHMIAAGLGEARTLKHLKQSWAAVDDHAPAVEG